MEPSLPPLHPRIAELLAHLGLRAVDAIKWNVLACVKLDDPGKEPTVILKVGTDERKTASIAYETRVMVEVLPTLDQSAFERLVLPEHVASGTHADLRYILVKHIPGHPLVYEWSELNFKPDLLGGKHLDPALAPAVVGVFRDLRLVDITGLPKFVRRFKFDEWLEGFRQKSETLVAQGLMERSTIEAADALFSSKTVSRYEGSMFTNGDFYPRNYIMLPEGKIAVVDWVGGVDPWEFVTMYGWLMMWGNPAWQQAYFAEIRKHFPIDHAEMQVGLLVKAFDQIYRWRDMPEEHIGFARTQMLAYFHLGLDVDYVRQLFA